MNSTVSDWMDKQIWPQIYAMIVNDAYFRLFEHAREMTGKFNGHIAQLVHDGYLSYQMIAIRRLCDKRDDVVSLWRAFIQARTDVPHSIDLIETTLQNLDLCSSHIRTQVNQHIAHIADPDRTRKPASWNMQMKHFTEAHEAICKAAITLDRDILRRQTLACIFPVYQGDIMEDFRHWVPDPDIKRLYKLWHAHVKKVDDWRHCR
jgi:hypothetical protein